jgi:hypothetical protein
VEDRGWNKGDTLYQILYQTYLHNLFPEERNPCHDPSVSIRVRGSCRRTIRTLMITPVGMWRLKPTVNKQRILVQHWMCTYLVGETMQIDAVCGRRMLAKAVISQKGDDQSPHGPKPSAAAQAATERDNLSGDAQPPLALTEMSVAMLCNGHLSVSSAERYQNWKGMREISCCSRDEPHHSTNATSEEPGFASGSEDFSPPYMTGAQDGGKNLRSAELGNL